MYFFLLFCGFSMLFPAAIFALLGVCKLIEHFTRRDKKCRM